MLNADNQNATDFSSQSSISSSDDSLVEDETLKGLKSLEIFAEQTSKKALKEGIQEAVKQLTASTQIKKVEKSRSYLPFSAPDLSMTQIFCIILLSWTFAAVLRYVFLADGKLAIRSPGPSKPFFPLNSSVTDFYRGDGASYTELYNQADLTILMFYAQWSLHSIEARNHFIRLTHAFKDVDNVKFSAVNCDVGTCKRSFKLYSYPVIIALTSSNTAVLYEDSPVTELMFSWITKLLTPLHRIDSIDDPLITSDKYDHVVLAYLPLKNGKISHAYRVYQLAAMKFKERVLFTVTIDEQISDHFGLDDNIFEVLNTHNIYSINENTTSSNVFNIIHSEIDAYKHSTVHWIQREYDDDGGKSIRLHSLVNESRALMILMTTPLTKLQTSSNLEKMRKMALLYNDCSLNKNVVESTDWAQKFVDESRLACDFRPEMVPDCCNTILHENFCRKSKDQSIDLTQLQYKYQCSSVVQIFGEDKLSEHCCKKRHSKLELTFEQKLNCRYLKLFNSTNPLELSKYSNLPSISPSNLKSTGLACRTNRTVQFAAMDKRFSDHFIRSWNLNTSNDDNLVLISVDDEAIHSKQIDDAFEDFDDFLTSYASRALQPTIFDETLRKSPFSEVKLDVEELEVSQIERLTAHTFKTKILNDTDRTYSAVVFFSGGSWHGQSMATTQIFHTVRHEFSQFDTLIRFFIIDTSRNSLPYAYVFDSLPSIMYFPAQPFPLTQSSHFPQELVFTVPNLMGFLLSKVQPELRFRVALRGCSRVCLETNYQRLHQFEDAIRKDIRMLRLMKRKYAHKFGTNFVTLMLRKRKLQTNAARYLQNVLKILHSNQSGDLQLSSYNETLIVRDSLLLRWLLSNNFGSNFNINSFRL